MNYDISGCASYASVTAASATYTTTPTQTNWNAVQAASRACLIELGMRASTGW